MLLKVSPRGPLQGEIRVPGDKSISHRAVIAGALACGETVVENFLKGRDCLSTIACLRQVAGDIFRFDGPQLIINGRGREGWREPDDVLDCGNSGTTIRLLTGLLAAQPFFSVLTGDASLRRRPMGRVAAPLRQMGAQIDGREEGRFAPLAIRGSKLHGAEILLPVASAQVKSACILAALFAEGVTAIEEPAPSRDHTERMLAAAGARIEKEGRRITVYPGKELKPLHLRVPGDISSAAFFLVAASIVPGSHVVIKDVGLNPTRDGIVRVLRQMGADIAVKNLREEAGEPVGDLEVRAASLRGTEVRGEIIPTLIDEIPVLAVAALAAQGETVVRDAEELRVKESDRISMMVRELSKMGAAIEELPDGFVVKGGKPLKGAEVESHGDHRIAMALAVAGLIAERETVVHGAEWIDISYPGFAQDLQRLQEG